MLHSVSGADGPRATWRGGQKKQSINCGIFVALLRFETFPQRFRGIIACAATWSCLGTTFERKRGDGARAKPKPRRCQKGARMGRDRGRIPLVNGGLCKAWPPFGLLFWTLAPYRFVCFHNILAKLVSFDGMGEGRGRSSLGRGASRAPRMKGPWPLAPRAPGPGPRAPGPPGQMFSKGGAKRVLRPWPQSPLGPFSLVIFVTQCLTKREGPRGP